MNDGTEEETVPVMMETSSYSQVVFNDVPPSYPPNTAVTCRYTLTGALEPSTRDWIGIYKVGWISTQKYYTYVWVTPSLDHVGPEPLVLQVVFSESYLPKDDGEFYQFCYVDSFGHVKGASTPFCFQNPAEASLGCSLEKDLLVITTQEQTEKMEKEKEDFMKEIVSLKETNVILKKELDERLHEICRLRSSIEDLKSKDKPESPLPDVPSFTSTEEQNYAQSLTSLQEKYDRAVQKIHLLKRDRTELQEQLELKNGEVLRLNTLLKETEQNYNKGLDQVKLLQVDVQSSRKDYEKLQTEIQELRMKKTLEDRRAENKALQTSFSEHEAQLKEENCKVQIQALLSQLTEARGLLRSEVQSCKEACKRAETAERELKEVTRKLEEITLKQTEDEKNNQIQAQLQQAQDKIYEMAETSRLDREKLVERNEELQAEVNKLKRALFDYQVASVAVMSDHISNPQSPSASLEQTYSPDSHLYKNIDDLTANPSDPEKQIRVCQHCHEVFPGINEVELEEHEQSHKAQLQQAQDKIYEMAETSRLDREKLVERNEELQAEVNKLKRALFDYQVASVAAMSDHISNPQSPSASLEQTYSPDSHLYDNIDDLTANPSDPEKQIRVCQHCHEVFPGINEVELEEHEQSHKVCPLCTLICDDMEQQEFEDHVYSHED